MADRQPGVAVVIPCFRQKRFLPRAIASAIEQSVPPAEIIVVDDGSGEDLSSITASFEGVKLICQENRGLAGARNTGLASAATEKIIFLDADDLLLPCAIDTGLKCFVDHPNAAFVYGGFQIATRHSSEVEFTPVATHNDLVRTNWIGMIATVMFDRSKLEACGGFDETLGMCEDWDAYLRLSRKLPFAAHPNIVAVYVRHAANASNNRHELRKWIAAVRAKEWERGLGPEGQKAWREGEELWRLRVPDPPRASLMRRLLRVPVRAVRRWIGA